MAISTFSGPIRSESTFKVVSKDPVTGTITEVSTLGDLSVSLADANVTLTNADHSGRVLLVPDGSQDNTYTLPAPVAFDNTGDGAVSVVFSDGNSNSKFQANVPGAAQVTVMALNATNWQISGRVVAAATPAFADQ